jgi:hypothetical protein
MKKMLINTRTFWCAALFSLGLTTRAMAFGQQGHEAIAILAQSKLESDAAAHVPGAQKALDQINQLLNGQAMADVAVWADWVRLAETNHLTKAQIKDINTRFPGNGDWHFVDLPLDSTAYSSTAPSAGPNDVVGGLGKCIAMLESADTSAQMDHHAVALKFLIHLVGDIHQPLHVACGYYEWNEDVVVMDAATVKSKSLPDDRGGNYLLTGSTDLHAIWDSDLVFIQVGKHSAVPAATVAANLAPDLTANFMTVPTSDYHGWPAAWAADSAKAAKQAYAPIQVPVISSAHPNANGKEIPKTDMVNFDKASYITSFAPEERQQLLKAAWNLATILEKIQWHN